MGFEGLRKDRIAQVLTQIKDDYKKRNVISFVSDFELVAGVLSGREIPYPYEDYAQDIAAIFKKELNKKTYENELRQIGKKMNDNHKQLLVARRAEYLCNEAYKAGNVHARNFSLRELEYAWDGLGGWMS